MPGLLRQPKHVDRVAFDQTTERTAGRYGDVLLAVDCIGHTRRYDRDVVRYPEAEQALTRVRIEPGEIAERQQRRLRVVVLTAHEDQTARRGATSRVGDLLGLHLPADLARGNIHRRDRPGSGTLVFDRVT